MTTQALVLADRDGSELEPLTAGLLPALLPIAGKPVIQHCIEDLWEAGVREILVVVPDGDRTLRRELGDGQRFGLGLRFLESGGQQWPGEVLALAGLPTATPVLVARGDMLRGRCAGTLLARSAEFDGDIVPGSIGGRTAGIALLRRRCKGVNQLDWSLVGRRSSGAAGSGCELGEVGLALLDGLPDLFDASLAALGGRYSGLLPEGRARPGTSHWIAPRASIARSAQVTGVARLGRGAQLHAQVELAGCVDVGDQCVIDEGAQLIDSVVLPGTYVGRGVRLQNAIARGSWLYRSDLGTCQRVDDPLLLAGPTAEAA